MAGEGEVYPDRELAINPGQGTSDLEGIQTKDPTFGLDAPVIATKRKASGALWSTAVR